MIIKNFDIGWGTQWPMKQLEQKIIRSFLAQQYTNDSKSVIINSVWYSDEYHQIVLNELQKINPTDIFVVSMLDPPIIQLDWFTEFKCNVVGIGYYPGPGFIDYFALFAEEFYSTVDQDILLNVEQVDTAYMCLNRKPHSHRVRLFQGLSDAKILECGFVSMGGNNPRLLSEDCNGQDIAPNPGRDQYGIANDIATLGNINNWQRHFINIVTETIWDIEPSNFISEKTVKPILGLRPFLIYAPNGGISCLKSRGIEHYLDDFQDITDIDLQQPYNIPAFLKELCKQPPSYWKMKLVSLRDKLLHNRYNFFKHAAKQKNIL